MKEIKFRAWLPDDKKMSEPFGLLDIVTGYNPGWYVDYGYGQFRIVGVLMQYTGLKDKNGKEIFEGDVVNLGETNIYYKVLFNKRLSAFVVESGGTSGNLGAMYLDAVEIVGNIHENPGLMEGE